MATSHRKRSPCKFYQGSYRFLRPVSILRKLFSDTVWYGLSSILGRLVNYALVPLYTAVLPVESNGVITLLYSYAAFFNVVLTFGMETAYFRFGRGSAEEEQRQAARGQTLIAFTCLAFLICMGIGWPWIEAYLGFRQTGILLGLMAAILISDALTAIPLARLRLAGKPKVFAAYRLGTILLNVGLSLLFLLVLAPAEAGSGWVHSLGADKQPVIWVLLANLLSNAPLLLLVSLRQFRPGLLRGADARFMVRYSWPIVLMGLAGMANQMLGTIQLENLLPDYFYPGLTRTEAVGVYGQCYKLSIFMALVVQAFRLGAEPFFFSMAGNEKKEEGFAHVMRWFVLACIGILVGVCINLGWIAPLVLRRAVYLTGLGVVPTLLVANLWLGVYYNLSVWFKLTDRTSWGTWLSVGGMVATILSNLAFIPTYGYEGAAFATLLCYFGMAAASYLIGQRYMPVPYPAGRLFLYVSIAYVGCMAFPFLAQSLSSWQVWTLRTVYAAAYALLLAMEALPLWKARQARLSSRR